MFGFGGLGGGAPAQKRNSKGSNRGSVDGGTAAKRASKDGAAGDGVVLDAITAGLTTGREGGWGGMVLSEKKSARFFLNRFLTRFATNIQKF